MNKNLIIGSGEVGRSLKLILNCASIDINEEVPKAEVIHICFPYTKDFVQQVFDYQTVSDSSLIIIHSTVPVGTTRLCGINAVHSPIRGLHPDLEKGIRVFVKFFGGPRAQDAASIFSELDIKVATTEKSENTEAMKLWDTEIYRESILLNKKIHKYCEDFGLDFDVVYTLANSTYNNGYKELGHPEYAKYVLKFIDGPIGGHCVEPNHKLLTNQYISKGSESFFHRFDFLQKKSRFDSSHRA